MENGGNRRRTRKSLVLETAIVTVAVLGAVTAVSLCKIPFFVDYKWLLIPLIFIIASLAAIRAGREDPREFGWTLRGWVRSLAETGVASLVIFPLFFAGGYIAIHYNIQGAAGSVPENPLNADEFFNLALYYFLYVALSEELFFRGYLQTRLSQIFKGRMLIGKINFSLACVAAAAVFAAGHVIVDPHITRVFVFFPALVYGLLRDRTRGLLAPFLFHGLCNMSMAVLLYISA